MSSDESFSEEEWEEVEPIGPEGMVEHFILQLSSYLFVSAQFRLHEPIQTGLAIASVTIDTIYGVTS